jgi:hypothetical protein
MGEKCLAHEEAISNLKDSDKSQWSAIRDVQNRPPVWCTVVISLLTFALGFVVAYASLKNETRKYDQPTKQTATAILSLKDKP